MWPGIRRAAAGVGLLLLAFALLQFAVLGTRGAGNGAFQSKAPGDVTVLTWNTLGEVPSVETVAELAIGADADVVVLPETTQPYAQQVADAMAVGGIRMAVHTAAYDDISKARSTSVLIDADLGEYVVDDTVGGTDTLPSLLLVPADGDGPRIVAAHPVAPVPGEMAGWRQGLEWLAARCAVPDTILAGDLNSTLDHYVGLPGSTSTGGLGGCHDGARATGNAAVGTWPTTFPALLGAPIDHVMATDDWEFVGFRVVESLDDAGSDHRPVIAQLRPVG
jgi:endonuclease/exonuclease/phosphatase (EEP) superfamily protein YafD